MELEIRRTVVANLLLVGILAATFFGVRLLEVPFEYNLIVVGLVAVAIKTDDCRIRRARRRAARSVPVTV